MSVAEVAEVPLADRAMDSGVGLRLLGGFDLTWDGERIPLPSGAQRVLAFLALQDRPVRRPQVAGTLWRDSTEKHASGSLRSALWHLRLSGFNLVEAQQGSLQLPPRLPVDYRHAIDLARSIFEEPRSVLCDMLDQHYFRRDILCDWYDEWVLIERERFHQFRLHVLEALCERLTEERRFGPAVDAGLAAVMGEPLRESAQRVLIRAYLAEGNRGEALRQYEGYRDLVRDELRVSPSRELEALVRF